MSVATTPDVDMTVLEELDFPIVCSLKIVYELALIQFPIVAKCDKPAVSLFTCRGCGESGTICGEHRAWMFTQSKVNCGHCKASGLAILLYQFTPIGGA